MDLFICQFQKGFTACDIYWPFFNELQENSINLKCDKIAHTFNGEFNFWWIRAFDSCISFLFPVGADIALLLNCPVLKEFYFVLWITIKKTQMTKEDKQKLQKNPENNTSIFIFMRLYCICTDSWNYNHKASFLAP